jgi:hypothetical protein
MARPRTHHAHHRMLQARRRVSFLKTQGEEIQYTVTTRTHKTKLTTQDQPRRHTPC